MNDYETAVQCTKIFGIEGTCSEWEQKASEFVDKHWKDIEEVAEAILSGTIAGTKYKLEGPKLYELLGRV